MTAWHVITGEYPPQPGGVSDYTQLVARGLASAGDAVTIWAPAIDARHAHGDHEAALDSATAGVSVRRLPGVFGQAALKMLTAHLDATPAPRRILVQYVPHAFGWKALNVPFCLWLRSRRHDSIWVMFHEVAFPIDRHQSLAQNAVGVVTRRMAAIVGRAAERAFVSIPAWEPVLRSLAASSMPIDWTPVPSAIAVVDSAEETAAVRARCARPDQPIVGHFGTYGALTRPLLEGALRSLLASSNCQVMLLGRDSDGVANALAARDPGVRGRVAGAGALPTRDISIHLSACDALLQPYPDGISSRRTSAMAGLAHGRPIATTDGELTETIWRESGAVVLSPAGDACALAGATAALVADRRYAARIGAAGRALYEERFDIRHTIAALRGETTSRSCRPRHETTT